MLIPRIILFNNWLWMKTNFFPGCSGHNQSTPNAGNPLLQAPKFLRIKLKLHRTQLKKSAVKFHLFPNEYISNKHNKPSIWLRVIIVLEAIIKPSSGPLPILLRGKQITCSKQRIRFAWKSFCRTRDWRPVLTLWGRIFDIIRKTKERLLRFYGKARQRYQITSRS